MTGETGPEYQRIMRLIRSRIISGEYPVGSYIPSTADLVDETRKSLPVVRRAVDQLKANGILQGHPGKGVLVVAVPADADSNRMTVDLLAQQLAALRQELDDLLSRIAHIETTLMDYSTRLGFDYPDGGERNDRTARQPTRRRRRTAT